MDTEKRKQQLKKAAKWLNKKTGDDKYFPVVANRRGYAEFIAYVFKLERRNKPSVWYCMEMESQWEPKSVKRICMY